MSGYYLMHRGWLDHPVFGGGREPYCRRAAWAWLIDHAAYDEVKVGVTNKVVTLRRGQLSYSLRYLANAWGWDDPKVRRFLTRLVGEMMIDTATDAGQTIITIKNYEQYQSFKSVEKVQEMLTDAPTDAATTQERRSNDANKKTVNTGKKEDVAKATSSAPGGADKPATSAIQVDFDEWYIQYPLKKDPKAAAKAYAAARKAGATKEGLLAAALRYAAECRARGTEKQYIKHPATWLNKGSWQNEPDLLTPTTTTNGASNVHKLTRDYQQDRDSTVRALYAAIPGLRETCSDELGDRRAGSF
jgi:hypothetical protein